MTLTLFVQSLLVLLTWWFAGTSSGKHGRLNLCFAQENRRVVGSWSSWTHWLASAEALAPVFWPQIARGCRRDPDIFKSPISQFKMSTSQARLKFGCIGAELKAWSQVCLQIQFVQLEVRGLQLFNRYQRWDEWSSTHLVFVQPQNKLYLPARGIGRGNQSFALEWQAQSQRVTTYLSYLAQIYPQQTHCTSQVSILSLCSFSAL